MEVICFVNSKHSYIISINFLEKEFPAAAQQLRLSSQISYQEIDFLASTSCYLTEANLFAPVTGDYSIVFYHALEV